MMRILRWLYKKLFSVDYILLEWKWGHDRKIQLLRNKLFEEALRKLGYRLETTLKADYFVEGDIPSYREAVTNLCRPVKINEENHPVDGHSPKTTGQEEV